MSPPLEPGTDGKVASFFLHTTQLHCVPFHVLLSFHYKSDFFFQIPTQPHPPAEKLDQKVLKKLPVLLPQAPVVVFQLFDFLRVLQIS